MQALLKFALISALIGTALLLFLSTKLEPRLISIEEIDAGKIDNFVKIAGNVTNIKDIENLLIIDVKDKSDTIKVVVYKSSKETIDLNIEMQVEVIGKVTEYKGELEIEASSIKQRG